MWSLILLSSSAFAWSYKADRTVELLERLLRTAEDELDDSDGCTKPADCVEGPDDTAENWDCDIFDGVGVCTDRSFFAQEVGGNDRSDDVPPCKTPADCVWGFDGGNAEDWDCDYGVCTDKRYFATMAGGNDRGARFYRGLSDYERAVALPPTCETDNDCFEEGDSYCGSPKIPEGGIPEEYKEFFASGDKICISGERPAPFGVQVCTTDDDCEDEHYYLFCGDSPKVSEDMPEEIKAFFASNDKKICQALPEDDGERLARILRGLFDYERAVAVPAESGWEVCTKDDDCFEEGNSYCGVPIVPEGETVPDEYKAFLDSNQKVCMGGERPAPFEECLTDDDCFEEGDSYCGVPKMPEGEIPEEFKEFFASGDKKICIGGERPEETPVERLLRSIMEIRM